MTLAAARSPVKTKDLKPSFDRLPPLLHFPVPGGLWTSDGLNRYATAYWLSTASPVLDYAKAMVSGSSSGTPTNWQEHITGKPQYSPPVLPLAPAKFTGGLYLKGNLANCYNFGSSEQKAYANYVQTVAPNGASSSPGMLGFMFWAAEYPSARRG